MSATEKVAESSRHPDNRLFQRHGLKLLNAGLLLYMCLGGFLFDSLGEFQADSRRDKETVTKRQVYSLGEVRLDAVRRMWNITNQLNILYESNWTLLVLDELLDFERRFLKTLAEKREQWDESAGEEGAGEGERDARREKNKKQASSRMRSIKKSLIHSLAVITTVGLPRAEPQSSAAKLATVLYGAFGVPLLFLSVSRTGRQMADSGLNGMILLRHYCFSLPIHYLCCSCNLFWCLRWLFWCCCCCCCCSWLCCNPRKKAPTCCDKEPSPRLRLRSGRGPRDGATRPGSHQAYVIRLSKQRPSDPLSRVDSSTYTNQRGKEVRLISSEDQNDSLEQVEVESLYSPGLFFTSVSLLGVYLAIGAYSEMQSKQSSLVDALYETYALLSTSKMPDSFNLDWKLDIAALYETLRPDLTKAPGRGPAIGQLPPDQTLIWDALYLICGLHLVSMCAHFARLWMSGDLDERFAKCIVIGSGEGDAGAAEGSPDEHLPSMGGSFDNNNALANFRPSLEQQGAEGSAGNSQAEHYVMQAASLAPLEHHQQDQSSVNLAELYVVSQHTSPAELAYQQAMHTSDVSFGSTDRSTTERTSLCPHHQAQQLPVGSTPGALYDPSILYGTHKAPRVKMQGLAGQQPNHINLNHNHLHLVAGQPAPRSATISDEGDEDEIEVEQMLKNCLDSKMRSSSSLLHLSRQAAAGNNHQLVGVADGLGSLHRSAPKAGFRVAPFENGTANGNCCEQESSLNTMDTNSNNTMSSSSSGTVRQPRHRLRPTNGIGFTIDNGQINKQ